MELLVIDDHPESRTLMQSIVSEAGHLAILASSRGSIPPTANPAVILTDLVPLVGYDSGAARTWVASLKTRFPSATIVVCTAYQEAGRDPHLGAAAVIDKPFDVEAVLEIIRRYEPEQRSENPKSSGQSSA